MSSVLQQLGSSEAILLMYLAGELPAEDRAAVEQRLGADPTLRAELERLREAQDAFERAMPALDRSDRLPAPEAAGVRRVVRAMNQWQARRLAAPPAPAPVRTLRYPWWAYPVAAAASVVVAFLVWWGNADGVRPLAEAEPADDVRPYLHAHDPAMQVAIAWGAMGAAAEEVDDRYRLVDPSDEAVLMRLIDVGPSETEPGAGKGMPADPGLDDDDFFLL